MLRTVWPIRSSMHIPHILYHTYFARVTGLNMVCHHCAQFSKISSMPFLKFKIASSPQNRVKKTQFLVVKCGDVSKNFQNLTIATFCFAIRAIIARPCCCKICRHGSYAVFKMRTRVVQGLDRVLDPTVHDLTRYIHVGDGSGSIIS